MMKDRLVTLGLALAALAQVRGVPVTALHERQQRGGRRAG